MFDIQKERLINQAFFYMDFSIHLLFSSLQTKNTSH